MMRYWILISFLGSAALFALRGFAQAPPSVPAAQSSGNHLFPSPRPAPPPTAPAGPTATTLPPAAPPVQTPAPVPVPVPPPSPSTTTPPPTATLPTPPAASSEATPDPDHPVFRNSENYQYDPTGRRDPFKPYGESQPIQANELPNQDKPPEPLQAFDIGQFKLLGIIWQVNDPKAMVADPNGKTYLIRRQTKIGRNNGFVAAIREGEVIVVEPAVSDSGMQTAITRVMSLK